MMKINLSPMSICNTYLYNIYQNPYSVNRLFSSRSKCFRLKSGFSNQSRSPASVYISFLELTAVSSSINEYLKNR